MYLKHGRSQLPEYKCWQQIKQRCLNPKHAAYPNYGGRGISVAPEWAGDFEAFFAHVGSRPTSKHSLERVDNDKGYEPGNCRWATWEEQARNRRPHGTAEGVRRPWDPGRTTNFKHGLIHTPEYRAWISMKDRCLNPKSSNYANWGGRGIGVCPEWAEDFVAFYNHVGSKPSPRHSLDRIDGSLGYEPGNVRWATKSEQSANRRPMPRGLDHGNALHGQHGTSEYRTWSGAKSRCFNSNHTRYRYYGGQGITMCQRWRDSFEAFLADVGTKPDPTHTILREDRAGHYSCGRCSDCEAHGWVANCRWSTRAEQNRTRRTSERSGKLTAEKVAEIRVRLAEGATQGEVARAYGVGVSLVGKIYRGQVWL